MPTYEQTERFRQDYKRLTRKQKQAFKTAVAKFVADLRSGHLRPGLRVKAVQGRQGVWEMTWAPDGRATFEYGPSLNPGDQHVIWRRIGGHDIFDTP